MAPFPPPYGGMGVRFGRLAASLPGRGYTCRKVRIEWVGEGDSWRALRRLLAFARPAWQVVGSDARIVHTTTGSVPNAFAISLVLLAARLSGRKAMLSVGGGNFARFAVRAPGWQRGLLRRLLSLAHLVLPCNEDLERALLRLGVPPARIVRISNALPDEIGGRAEEEPEESLAQFRAQHAPTLAYVGALYEHYGLIDLLSALGSLSGTWPQLGLVALLKEGVDEGFARRVDALVRREGLAGRVRMYRSVPWAVAAMRECDLVVRATNTADGDSRAVREALAVGTPVVASDIGHRPPGVTLYRAGDAADLARAVREVLQGTPSRVPYIDPEGAENMCRYDALYRSLLEPQGGSHR